MNTDTDIQTYPPLESCVLLDSRMSMRVKIRDLLKSTMLFERIMEPSSLEDALEIISAPESSIDFDSCVFGPGISEQSIELFIRDFKKIKPDSYCSFVALRNENTLQEDPQETIENIEGVHAQGTFPCSKHIFNELVVESLQKANNGSLEFSRRVNPMTGKPLILAVSVAKLGMQTNSVQDRTHQDVSKAHSFVLKLRETEPFNFKFRVDGTPSATTKDFVTEVIEEVFVDDEHSEEITAFKIDLAQFFYAWIQDAQEHGKKEANRLLKGKLLLYFTPNSMMRS